MEMVGCQDAIGLRHGIALRAGGSTFRVEQARDGEMVVRQREGVLEALVRRARGYRGVVEERGPPAVQQRVQRQPGAPRRREVSHVHAGVLLSSKPSPLPLTLAATYHTLPFIFKLLF